MFFFLFLFLFIPCSADGIINPTVEFLSNGDEGNKTKRKIERKKQKNFFEYYSEYLQSDKFAKK